MLAATLSVSGSAVGAGPPECLPARDLGNKPTVDRKHGPSPQGGFETTIAFAGGGYRVFQCSSDGTLVSAMNVGYAEALGGPDGYIPVSTITRQEDRTYSGEEYTYAALDGSDPEALLAWKGEDGERLRTMVIPPTEGTDLASPGGQGDEATMSTTSSTPGCDDGHYTLWPASWPNGYYGYQANLGNFPAGDETRQEITKGHHSWDYTNNPCGFNDITDLVADYRGEVIGESYSRINDGVNVIDFGDMEVIGGSNETTLAMARSAWYSNGDIFETDQRYNIYKEWSNNGDGTKYDVYNVATHESGHSIGIDGDYEANTHGNLTMYCCAYHGETKDRSLARGDILGMRNLYP